MTFRVGLVQLAVGGSKAANLKAAISLIGKAKQQGAKLVSLPECFNSPYGTKYFPEYAESIPDGESTQALSTAAKENDVYIIGGSIPERDGDKLYNTCCVFNNKGDLIEKFRKIHLFDIDIPGKITFKESDVLTGGESTSTFNIGDIKVGLGICYDIRFPQLAQKYRREGCDLLVYPGAFNMTTGPAHWAKLQISRALDNQLYVMTVSPARDLDADYHAWGHSMVVNPWGDILVEAEEKESVLVADIDLEKMHEIRNNIPISAQAKHHLY